MGFSESSSPSSNCSRSITFFYGTLKYGFPNWKIVPQNAVFLGSARTTVPHPLVVDSDMRVPYLLPLPGHPHALCVHGELYSVTAEELDVLDRFEGVPIDFYARKGVEVIVTAETDEREKQPDPTTGQMMNSGSVLLAGTYLRSKGGAEWAQKWTVERLQTLPMSGRYTLQDSESYISQSERP